jgi:hypothetical protein
MLKYNVPIKSIDLARDLYYKDKPSLGRSTMSNGFHQHLRSEYGIKTIVYANCTDSRDSSFNQFHITFASEQAATFFLLKFS